MNLNHSSAEVLGRKCRLFQKQETTVDVLPSVHSDEVLKRGIWIYFVLLIFEGALRKWFLPGLSTPLLIVRDPLALWLIYVSWSRGLLPANLYLSGFITIGIISYFSAVFLGHGNLLVALFGARIFLIHLPLVFVIGRALEREDVEKIGRLVLYIAIPMTILIGLQFYSPQSAWVNRGVGGDLEGAGFGGALGFFRPPGSFSFTNGNTLFYSLVSAYVFYFWVNPAQVSRLLLLCATAALIAAIPLSISRGLLFQVGVSLVFTLIAVLRKSEYLGRITKAIILGVIALVLLSNTIIFQKAVEAFSTRFESASETEGGLEGTLLDRFLGGLINALTESTEQPFWGYGLGMGTNVGSSLLTGSRGFLIAEGEWARLTGELGPLMGVAVIFLRLGVVAKIALASFKRMLAGDTLPWLLLSFGGLVVAQGPWAQPTALGFSTLIGGLMIASMRNHKHCS